MITNASRPSRWLGALSAIFALSAFATGCGGTDDKSQVDAGNGNTNGAGNASGSGSEATGNGTTAGNGNGNGNGNGASSSGSDVDLSDSIDDGTTTTVIDPTAACAKGTATATLSGVNMFVMFDRSSSMNQAVNQNGTRWELTSTALNAFFASEGAAGLRLALRFFPHDLPASGCNQTACDLNACATPLVDLAALTAEVAPTDAQEAALLNATAMSTPGMAGQGTPIYAALGGALQRAVAQRQQTPEENSVVVLVTDGEPNGCDTDIGHIAALAAASLASDGVRTYAIGLTGSQEADMDQIATAGGTSKGIFISDGANTKQELLDALSAIRGQVLDCDFALPEPKAGVAVDTGLININYTPSGGQPTTLKQVPDEAACAANGGWYYDNPASPTRIVLCKSTCDNVTIDVTASVDILLGCATATDAPR